MSLLTVVQRFRLWLAHRVRWGVRRGEATFLQEAGEVDPTLQYCQQTLKLFRAKGDRQGEALALWSIGEVQRLQGKYDQALQSFQQAFVCYRRLRDLSGEARALLGIGQVQLWQGQCDWALESFKRALRYYRRLEDRQGEARTFREIGQVQRLQNKYDWALESYQLALELYRQVGDRQGEAHALWGIGEVQRLQGKVDQALQHCQWALELFREVGNQLGEAHALRGIGDVQRLEGQWDPALQSYQLALRGYQEAGDRGGEAHALWGIGEVQRLQGKHDQALQSYQLALRGYQEAGDRHGEAHALWGIGEVQRLESQWDQALQSYQLALGRYRQWGDRRGEANVLLGVSGVQRLRGEYNQALESLVQALELYRQMGDRRGEAHALWGIGKVQRFQGEYDRALQSYQLALGHYQAIGDRLGEANALREIGQVQRLRGEYNQALESLVQALELYQQVGNRPGMADTLGDIGDVQYWQRRCNPALESHREALKDYQECLGLRHYLLKGEDQLRDEYNQALESIGFIHGYEARLAQKRGGLTDQGAFDVQHCLQEKYDPPLESYRQALELYRQLGDCRGEARTLRDIGDVQHLLGEYDHALESYQQALGLYREVENQRWEAYTLFEIGRVQRLRGEYDRALGSLVQAAECYLAVGDLQKGGSALWEIGTVEMFMQKYDQALKSYQTVLEFLRGVGDQRREAHALQAIGAVQCLLDERDLALESFRQALKLHRAMGDRSDLIDTYNNMELVYQDQGKLFQAHQAYLDALEYMEAPRNLQLQEEFRQSILDRIPLQGIHYRRCHPAIVPALLGMYQLEVAWHFAEQDMGRTLLDLLGSVRPRLDSREKQETYEEWQRLEQETFALEERLHYLDRDSDSPACSEQQVAALSKRLAQMRQEENRLRQQVAQLLEEGQELIQVSELRGEELALSLHDLARLQDGRPDARPLLVEYFLMEGDRYALFLLPLWQVAPEQQLPLHAFPISLPKGTLNGIIDHFVNGLAAARRGFAGRYRGEAPAEAQGLSEAEREASRQAALATFAALPAELGEAFVRPWKDMLEKLNPTELLLVPHGALHLLPLHAALLDDGTPLIDGYPLVYLANAALAKTLLRRRQAKEKPEGRLVMGPPADDLPYAWVETQGLAEDWGLKEAGQPYALERMRVQVLREHARRLERVHLATHSAFDPRDYLQSYIQFFGERLTLFGLVSDERLDFHGMRLFYLSSCEGGLGWPGRANELQGLVWALIYAGANAVMASLWPVDDGAAEYMASAFYYHWEPGTSLMEAYRKTIGQMRKDPSFENPYYWGPMVLFGDGF